MCICVCGISESLNLLASKTFFFNRKIQLYLVQIHRDDFSNVKQPANYGVNTKRGAQKNAVGHSALFEEVSHMHF